MNKDDSSKQGGTSKPIDRVTLAKLIALGVSRSTASEMTMEEAAILIRDQSQRLRSQSGEGVGSYMPGEDGEGGEGGEGGDGTEDVPESGTADGEGNETDARLGRGGGQKGGVGEGQGEGDPIPWPANGELAVGLAKSVDMETGQPYLAAILLRTSIPFTGTPDPAVERQVETVVHEDDYFHADPGRWMALPEAVNTGAQAVDETAGTRKSPRPDLSKGPADPTQGGLPTQVTLTMNDGAELKGHWSKSKYSGVKFMTQDRGALTSYDMFASYGGMRSMEVETDDETIETMLRTGSDGEQRIGQTRTPKKGKSRERGQGQGQGQSGESGGDMDQTSNTSGESKRPQKKRLGLGDPALRDLARTAAASDPVVKRAVDEALASNDRLRSAVFRTIQGNKTRVAEALGIPDTLQALTEALKGDVQEEFNKGRGDLEKWKKDTEAKMTTTVRIEVPDSGTTIEAEGQHYMFPALVRNAMLRIPSLMVGPSGSGKSTAAKMLAEHLGLPFSYMALGPTQTESKLAGYTNVEGAYIPTDYYLRYKYGGVMLLDEMDASEPSVLVWANNSIQSKSAAFPRGYMSDIELAMLNGKAPPKGSRPMAGGMVDMHPDCIIVASANTYGKGADLVYQGRNALDGSTLKRFLVLTWDYDEGMERRLAGNDEWVDVVQEARRVVSELRMEHIVSPVDSINGAKLLATGPGVGVREVMGMTILAGLSKADRQRIESSPEFGKLVSRLEHTRRKEAR